MLRPRTALPVTVVNLTEANDLVPIVSWRICGPFIATPEYQKDSLLSESHLFAADYLKTIGGRESPLMLSSRITHIKLNFDRDPSKEPTAPLSPNVFLNQNQQFPTPDVDSQLIYWGAYHVFKVIYAAANIDSKGSQDTILVAETNSPVKIWLNGEVQITSGSGNTSDPNFAIRVHLRPGHNILLVKEICFPLRNDFAMWFTTESKARELVQARRDYFRAPTQLIFPRGVPLRIAPVIANMYSTTPGAEGHYEISTVTGKVIITNNITESVANGIDLSSLPDGLYSIRLSKGNTFTTSDLFFVGNLAKRLAMYKAYCSTQPRDSAPCIALPRLIQACESSGSFHFEKQHLAVFLMAQLEWTYHGVPSNKTFNDDVSRIRLVSFRSKLDGTIQHYYLYRPADSFSERYLPVVVAIIPQPAAYTQFFSPLGALESYAKAADRYHLSVIVPLARHDELHSTLIEDDILESLHHAEVTTNIDRNRIYVAGECDGGRVAIQLAENYPNVFSALSTLRARIGHPAQYNASVLDVSNVFLRLSSIASIPIRLVHSEIDFHSPLSQDLDLCTEAKNIGFSPQLRVLPGTGEFDLTDPDDEMFEFFSKSERASDHKALRPSTLSTAFPSATR